MHPIWEGCCTETEKYISSTVQNFPPNRYLAYSLLVLQYKAIIREHLRPLYLSSNSATTLLNISLPIPNYITMRGRHSKTPVFTIEQRKDLLQTWTNIGRGLISTGQTTYLFQVLNVASSTLHESLGNEGGGTTGDASFLADRGPMHTLASCQESMSTSKRPNDFRSSAFGSTSWAPSSTPAFGIPNTFGNVFGSQGALAFAGPRAPPFSGPQKSPMKLGVQNIRQSQEMVTEPESALLSGPASENGTAEDLH